MLCRCASLELFWSRVCSGRPSSSTSALVVFVFRLISGRASDHSTSWNCRETMRNRCFLDNIRCCNDLVQSISAKATRKFWAERLRRGIQVGNQRHGGLGETLCEVLGLPNEDPLKFGTYPPCKREFAQPLQGNSLNVNFNSGTTWVTTKSVGKHIYIYRNEMGIVMSCKALNMSKCRVDMDKTWQNTGQYCRNWPCQVPTFSITGAVVVFMSTLGATMGAVAARITPHWNSMLVQLMVLTCSYQAFESAESNQQLLLVGDLNQIWSPAIIQCHLGARLQPVYPESPAGRSIMASIYFALLGIGGCCLGEGGGESPAALALKKQWRHWNPKMPQGTLVLGDAWWCLWS